MPPLFNQIFGMALLAGGMVVAELWLQRRKPLSGALRQARILVLMAAVGGLFGAPAWWQNLPFAFAWPLPPVAARYLACAAAAFAVVGFRAAWIGTTGHLRLIAALLLVYLGPLAVAAVALHRDRFDFAAPITFGFFAIVGFMVIAAVFALMRLPSGPRGLSGGLLGLIGAVTGLWGLALFLWPAGPIPLIWPWAADPLTSRLIAAMFLTVAAACLLAQGPAERRSALILCLIYGAGIAATTALALGAGKPVSLVYLAVWAAIAGAAAWKLSGAADAPEALSSRRD